MSAGLPDCSTIMSWRPFCEPKTIPAPFCSPMTKVISVQTSNQVARWCCRERQFLGLPGVFSPKKSKRNVKEHGPLEIWATGIPWHILEPNPRNSGNHILRKVLFFAKGFLVDLLFLDCQYAGDELIVYRDTHLRKLTASPSQEVKSKPLKQLRATKP